MRKIEGKVVFVAPEGKGWSVGEIIEYACYGESIDFLLETEDGKLFACCDDEPQATQINFNPFTGEPAKVKIGE